VVTTPGTSSSADLSVDRTLSEPPITGPVEVALTAGCHLSWRKRADADSAEVSLWLQRALDSVAAELLTDVVTRYHTMHSVLARTVGELATNAVANVHVASSGESQARGDLTARRQ
jgi:hypothetical protein